MTELSASVGASVQALIQLYAIAVLLSIALEQVFDNGLYQRLLGKGVNGKPSLLFPAAELRPYIATAVGVLVAFAAQLQALASVLQVDMASGGLGTWGAVLDRILTGVLLGGGAKTVKKLAKGLTQARTDMTSPPKE